jgi:hypothetical protein
MLKEVLQAEEISMELNKAMNKICMYTKEMIIA